MPNSTKLNAIGWNEERGWIACGGDDGLLKVIKLESGKGQGGGNLSMNQNLQGHQGTLKLLINPLGGVQVIDWNENFQKLTTADDSGLIIVWMVHKGHWFEEMINNRNKSVVRDMKWMSSGEKICIVYEDGAVIVGSVEGNRLWGKEFDYNLTKIEWSPDGKTILFGTPAGEVKVHDYVGNYLFKVKIFAIPEGEEAELADLQWFESSRVGYSYEDLGKDVAQLCIAYQNGMLQLMKSETDDQPVIIDTGMVIVQARWNPNGNVLAVGGSMMEGGDQKGAVQFYTPDGHHLRTLRVPSQSGIVKSVSWEGYGLRMCLAVDSSILFANIQPEYRWAFFNNTLVFAFTKPEKNEMTIMFWDTVINERHVRYMRRLLHVKACGDYCVLVAETEEKAGEYILILSNAVGCPIDSKVINIEP
jgi:WD repeat-containing protein 35